VTRKSVVSKDLPVRTLLIIYPPPEAAIPIPVPIAIVAAIGVALATATPLVAMIAVP
jgi:hypothetical protein